mmetsp:Transcript_19913/g.36126  ORF Transcript_19913/g.36126 Transcript_19913/m.36126 type:complete len:558 (-) Transcript_19913:33-1706(-)
MRNLLLMSPCIVVTAGAFLVVGSRPNRNPLSCFSHPITTTHRVLTSTSTSTVSSSGVHCGALLYPQARRRQNQIDHVPSVFRRNSGEDRFTCVFQTRLFNSNNPADEEEEEGLLAEEEDDEDEELLLLELDNLDNLYVEYEEEDDDYSDNTIETNDNEEDDEQNELFLRQELGKLNDLEAMLLEMEEDLGISLSGEDKENETLSLSDDNNMSDMGERQKAEDAELLEQLLGGLLTDDTIWEEENTIKGKNTIENDKQTKAIRTITTTTPSPLERALLQGVVPADAGVGSGCLPGDYGFDPLNVATKDYFRQVQTFLLKFLNWGGSDDNEDEDEEQDDVGAAMPKRGFVGNNDQGARPPALILRDYREAEIRHGRLAMLAALFWPLQEILDRMFLPETFGSTTVIYGGTTLPYLTPIMTLFMMLLGYLDIYAKTVKDNDTGEAFLPGECFWDPLNMLEGAPDTMKRNMQERELINGRVAMVAVGAFIFEEAASHRPIVSIPGNELLFTPAYQIPAIQAWLDNQFQAQYTGEEDFVGVIQDIIKQQDIPIEDITSSFLP